MCNIDLIKQQFKFLIMEHFFKANVILVFSLSLFLLACSESEKPEDINNEISLIQEKQSIRTRNVQAFNEAETVAFDDTVFLKTKQPMSAKAIDIIDYETGLVGDNAYNRKVYMYAVERLKKNSYIKNNQVYTSVKSGAEINMSEDLFDYLINVLFKDWNTALKEGRYEVVIEENGFFYMAPMKKKNRSYSYFPYHVLDMSESERLNALKHVYDINPTGYLSEYIVLNFGSNLSGYSGSSQYFVCNGCAEFGDQNEFCYHNSIGYSHDSRYQDRTIYKVFNTNHLVLISIQVLR